MLQKMHLKSTIIPLIDQLVKTLSGTYQWLLAIYSTQQTNVNKKKSLLKMPAPEAGKIVWSSGKLRHWWW